MFSYSRPSPDDSLPLEEPEEEYSSSSLSYPYREGSPVFSGQRSFCEGGPDSCFLNLMMYDMADEASKLFYKDGNRTAKDVTVGMRSRVDGRTRWDCVPCSRRPSSMTICLILAATR